MSRALFLVSMGVALAACNSSDRSDCRTDADCGPVQRCDPDSGECLPLSGRVPGFFCVSQPDENARIAAAVEGDYWDWFMGHMDSLGVAVTRVSGPTLAWAVVEPVLGGGYDFRMADEFIERMGRGALPRAFVMTLNPTMGGERDPAGADREAYQAFLEAVFDRYAPGGAAAYRPETPVRYFQVGNEIQDVPEGLDYVALVEVTAEVARGYPEIRLLGVGAPASFYEPVIPVLAERGLGDVLAGVDIHGWNRARLDELVDGVASLRAMLDQNGLEDLSVWSLESGTYQGCPTMPGGQALPELSEADQALFLVASAMRSRRAGLDVFCWNNLVDWLAFEGDPDGIFSAMGLIGDGEGNACEDPARLAVPRIAYYAFQRLSRDLEGATLEGACQIDDAAEPVDCTRFVSAGGDPTFVLWTAAAAPLPCSLRVDSARVRYVPLITDLDGQAPESELEAADGAVALQLDGAALVVEK